MSVLLPVGIPAGFTPEPATGAQVSDVYGLVAAEQTAAFGFCPDTEEDVRSLLEPPARYPLVGAGAVTEVAPADVNLRGRDAGAPCRTPERRWPRLQPGGA